MGSALIRRSTGLVVNQPLRLQERARAGMLVQPAFNPRLVPGLGLWLDPDDASTITDVSGACSQINDKSGNGRDFAQSNSLYRPAITANGSPSGRTVLTFDGTNDYITSSYTPARPITLFIVLCQLSLRDAIVVGHNPGNRQTLRENLGSTGSYAGWFGGSDLSSPSADTNFTTPHAVAVTIDSTGLQWWRDGRSFGTNSGATESTVYVTQIPGMLGITYAAYLLNGWIGDVLVYERVLEENERRYIWRGLGNKWGILQANIQ
jgi:hypothetical protein